LYGGTERVVSYLTEELVNQGHDVSLFASGDSVTQAQLIPVCPQSLRLDPTCVDQLAHHMLMLEKVVQLVEEFDLIHFHTDYLSFGLMRQHKVAHVTTLHGRLDLPDLIPIYREFDEVPVISISDAQRKPLFWINWQATVHHGLPKNLYRLHEKPGQYLAFLGRVSPEKGVDRAIEIARKSGTPLRVAAKIDRVDQDYFDEVIRPLLDGPLVEFLGEIGEDEKDEFLGNALALVLPIDWPEPFGLVMIEAMACGTPVVTYCRGSVPEIIENGVTGYIVSSIAEAVEKLKSIPNLSRSLCRQIFEQRFTAKRMAEDYMRVYEQCLCSDFREVA
jgi:glycosyltransferase involved in cell wall biosynthesis